MKLVLASHNVFAKAILTTAEMFLGEQENAATIGLFPGDNAEDFEDSMRELVGDTSNEDCLILCDILGGTPFNTASKISYKDDHVKVMYGMNLPMVMEAINERDSMSLEELVEDIKETVNESYGIGKY